MGLYYCLVSAFLFGMERLQCELMKANKEYLHHVPLGKLKSMLRAA